MPLIFFLSLYKFLRRKQPDHSCQYWVTWCCSKWICRNGNATATGPVCRVLCFQDLFTVACGCTSRPISLLKHRTDPSLAGHFIFDLNDPNLNSWCACLISARIRFNLYLMIFWLQALLNCQAELALRQARSGREGPGPSLVPESSICIYTCNAYLHLESRLKQEVTCIKCMQTYCTALF